MDSPPVIKDSILMESPPVIKKYSKKKRNKVSRCQEQKSLHKKRINPFVDEEEERHFQRVVNAFKCYRAHLGKKFETNIHLIESLPGHQQRLLKSYKESLYEAEKCVDCNQDLIKMIIKDVDHMFENTVPAGLFENDLEKPSSTEIERVQVTLKQFVRDWSKEGAEERETCYQPIIDELVKNFPPDQWNTAKVKVLVPGAGLGRLAFEIAIRGYSCQGNEFSLFMLIASNFVLNRCPGVNMFSVYPWVYQVDNNLTSEHQMQKIRFPDVNPSALLRNSSCQFSMAAGDFLEIYRKSGDWHCIATCFFIDCANNIVDFIEKIYDILKPGGLWINLGPLLYHYSNVPEEFSIEPPYSTVKEVISGVGFIMEKEDTSVRTTYGQNPKSMLYYEYNSVFFVCRKPL